MKVTSVLLAGTLLVSAAAAQTVLMSQDFNSEWSTANPPAGWRIYCDPGDTSTNDWHRGPDTARNRWPDNITGFAVLDSYPDELGDDSLISPLINIEGRNAVSLRCSTFFRGSNAPYYARLMGAVDGRPFVYVIFDYNGLAIGPALQDFNLSWAAGHRQLQVAWVFTGFSGGINFWAIDNVSIIGDTVAGVEQDPGPPASRRTRAATIVRGELNLPASGVVHGASSMLLNIGGRDVLNLHAGSNDVSKLPPGVYFVREARAQAQAQVCRKVVIAK